MWSHFKTFSTSAFKNASTSSGSGSDVSKSSSGTTSSAPPPNPNVIQPLRMSPTKLDRIFLRWSGQFKKGTEIPGSLPGDVVLRARSFARIRINIGFLLIAAVGAYINIRLGRRDVARGESVEKRNLEWHRQINEEHSNRKGTEK